MRRSGLQDQSLISHLAVAVIEPEFDLNLGYVARTMANFGMRKLFIISSRKFDKIKLEEASRYASHGHKIIEEMKVIESMSLLRERFSTLIGTTAIQATRKSNIARRTLDLDYFASKFALRKTGHEDSICIVLGRDTTGMTNSELKKCDYNITIRTGSEYNTLNISHAAAIIFYALSKSLKFRGRARTASTSYRREKDIAVTLFERLAADAEFHSFKSKLLSQTLTNLFNRSEPTLKEIYLLMGLANKASSKIRRLTPSS